MSGLALDRATHKKVSQTTVGYRHAAPLPLDALQPLSRSGLPAWLPGQRLHRRLQPAASEVSLSLRHATSVMSWASELSAAPLPRAWLKGREHASCADSSAGERCPSRFAR
jgi:hypothetical protein